MHVSLQNKSNYPTVKPVASDYFFVYFVSFHSLGLIYIEKSV